MADKEDDMEWYEEPVTIVGFVAGFLLLVLVIASILILCYSRKKGNEEEEDNENRGAGNSNINNNNERHSPPVTIQINDVPPPQQLHNWDGMVSDKTNPLYLNANDFPLHQFPRNLRAQFVHIHVDDDSKRDDSFISYYEK